MLSNMLISSSAIKNYYKVFGEKEYKVLNSKTDPFLVKCKLFNGNADKT